MEQQLSFRLACDGLQSHNIAMLERLACGFAGSMDCDRLPFALVTPPRANCLAFHVNVPGLLDVCAEVGHAA